MSAPSKIEQISDEELLSIVRNNNSGLEKAIHAKLELERRNTERLLVSSNQVAESAASMEKTDRRMLWATWVILIATIVQLELAVLPMVVHEHHPAVTAAPQTEPQPAVSRTEPQQVMSSLDETPQAPEQVKADVKAWQAAELAVMCSGKDQLLPMFSMDGKGKQVVLNCTITNRTNKAVPLTRPDKVEALFRLPDNKVVRGRAYLGSSQHQVPANGDIKQAGLYPGDKDCPAKESDYDCAQAELMKASELLITDTANGIHYHVSIK